MKTLLTLTKSTFKMFVRNKQSLFFALFMPVMIMTIFGLIGFDRAVQIDIGIVQNAPNEATKQFIQQLSDMSVLKVSNGTMADEKAALEKGDRDLVIEIPDNLLPPLPNTAPATITVYKNMSQEQLAQTAISLINQILDKTSMAMHQVQPVATLSIQDVSTRDTKYIDFLLPGIIAMAVMQMAVFSVAFVFADYKEKGILKRLIATPMKPYQFVTANVVVRLTLAVAQTAILIVLGVLFYHAHVFGSYFLVLLIALLGGVMFLGLGFTISGIAKTVESVPALANVIVFPMMFLSGIFFPISAMPDWLQHVVKFLPLTYFSHAMREVMAQGATISAIKTDLLWMGAWAVILVILSSFTFGMEEKRV